MSLRLTILNILYFELFQNKNFKPDDFDLVLKLARFHALSYGRNNMTYEDYEYVVYLENERKDRVSKFIPIKNK